jgi:hypothetical protein
MSSLLIIKIMSGLFCLFVWFFFGGEGLGDLGVFGGLN